MSKIIVEPDGTRWEQLDMFTVDVIKVSKEGLKKLIELINNPPDPSEDLRELMRLNKEK